MVFLFLGWTFTLLFVCACIKDAQRQWNSRFGVLLALGTASIFLIFLKHKGFLRAPPCWNEKVEFWITSFNLGQASTAACLSLSLGEGAVWLLSRLTLCIFYPLNYLSFLSL